MAFIAATIVIVAAGFALRASNLDEPNLAFRPERQFDSAIVARDLAVDLGGEVDGVSKDAARPLDDKIARREAPILPLIAALEWRASGTEHLWFPRLVNVVVWLALSASLALFARSRFGDVGALATLVFALFDPFAIVASRSFQPDALMVAGVAWTWMAVVRWSRTRQHSDLILAAFASGATVLVKGLALPFTLGAFLGIQVFALGFRRALSNVKTWAFAAATILPWLAYQLAQTVAGNSVGGSLREYHSSQLLTRADFYTDLLARGNEVVGIVGAVLGIGFLLARTRGAMRASTIGLLIGGLIYTVAFDYRASTHNYYELWLVIPVALGIGALADWITQTLASRTRLAHVPIGVSAIVVVALVIAVPAITDRSTFDEWLPSQAREIGAAVGHSSRVATRAPADGTPHWYYGAFAGSAWPNTGDLKFRALQGAVEASTQDLFDEVTRDADYFVDAAPAGTTTNSQLEAILVQFPVIASGENWTVYDLRDR